MGVRMKLTYSNEFKIKVLKYLDKVGSVAKTAHEFGVHPSTIYGWKAIGVAGLSRHLAGQSDAQNEDLQKRIRQLERENSVLREAAKLFFEY